MSNNRYEVIADYPKCTVSVGQILHAETPDEKAWCDKYPHLFRLLKWWEHVPVDELPKYIKSETTDVVAAVGYELCGYDIYAKNTRSELWHKLADYADGTIPATESEYNDYINKLNAK